MDVFGKVQGRGATVSRPGVHFGLRGWYSKQQLVEFGNEVFTFCVWLSCSTAQLPTPFRVSFCVTASKETPL
jgi:hypothetical protein